METDPAWEIHESMAVGGPAQKRRSKFAFSMFLPLLSYGFVALCLLVLADKELDQRNMVNAPALNLQAETKYPLELPASLFGLGAVKLESGEIIYKFELGPWLSKLGPYGQNFQTVLPDDMKSALNKMFQDARKQGKNYLALGLSRHMSAENLSKEGEKNIQMSLLQNALALQSIGLGVAKEKLLLFSTEILLSQKGHLSLSGKESGKVHEVLLLVFSHTPFDTSRLDGY